MKKHSKEYVVELGESNYKETEHGTVVYNPGCIL